MLQNHRHEKEPKSDPLKINTALAKMVDSGPLKNWDMIRTNIFLDKKEKELYAHTKMPSKRCHAACCAVGNKYIND